MALHRIATIAYNTYREAVRARVLFGLGALALGTTLYSIAVGAFTLKNAPRVVADLGAASISIYAVLVSVVIAGTSLYRELEQKTLFPILARPVRRGEYLVGKYLGTVLTLLVFIAFDAAAALLVIAAMAGKNAVMVAIPPVVAVAALVVAAVRAPRVATWLPVPLSIATAAAASALAWGSPDELRVVLGSSVLALFEVGIVAGFATLFASFSSPFLSTIFTLGIFVVGRSADTLAKLPVRIFGPAVRDLAAVVAKVVPNLQVYVPPRPLLTGEAPDTSLLAHLLLAGAQSLAWAVALLAVSSLVFRKRDFL